ncbi:MAG TPA: BatD family protein [Deltaproteobacteria bacterium]|nr:BatD family protein [Deltaproteobacteria bacterium]
MVPFFVLILMAFLPLRCLAAPSVGLELDRAEATLEDTVTLKVRVSGISPDAEPRIAGLKDLTVVAGGTSTRIEIINFRKSEHIEYLYYLQPKGAGTYRIGPAEVSAGGRVYRSQSAVLTVREAAPARGGQAVAAEGPLFLRAELSKGTAYADEPVIYTIRLYRLVKVSLRSLDIPDNPPLAFKKLGDPLEYTTSIDGQTYQVYEVRLEVTAQEQGRYKLPPATMDLIVYESSRSPFPFNDPFFSRSNPRPRSVRSNALELVVLPLPAQGRPADYSSLVGSFTMDAKLDRTTLDAGETATLTVTVQGRGNTGRIPDLSMPDIPGLRVYPDQPVLQTDLDASGSLAVKTMKWALVPQQEGIFEIPSLSLGYFDTGSKSYRVLNTPKQTITVKPGTQAQAAPRPQAAPPAFPRPGVQETGRDIMPIHTGAQAFAKVLAMPGAAVAWLVLLAPPLIFLGAWGLKRRMASSRRNGDEDRTRGALKAFRKTCSRESGAEELLSAVRGYFNSRFGSSLGALTPGDADRMLKAARVDDGVRMRCVSLIEELTHRVYTGRGRDAFERADELFSLMREIDRQGR